MRVLLAEDDGEAAGYIERGLAELGHCVTRVDNGADALRLGIENQFDIIVLDRMMPEIEGLDVVCRLREVSVATPILMLTAKGGIADRVDGLNAGADDYLTKPFAFSELLARMNALIRRGSGNDQPTRLEVGDIALDLLRRRVTRAGQPISLQPRELALLEQLMRNAGRPVTRTMFLEQVWGFHFDPLTNIVESHLSRLRAKLREGFADDPIETIRGVGYRMRANG
ncbi:MAG TPA: response regulator transcription factor [Novosphingobium sp.]|nr:response regulator transcription factor [Novosphingobium sp.]